MRAPDCVCPYASSDFESEGVLVTGLNATGESGRSLSICAAPGDACSLSRLLSSSLNSNQSLFVSKKKQINHSCVIFFYVDRLETCCITKR